MSKILIIGSESVAGANLAARWSGRSNVYLVSLGRPVQIDGCVSWDAEARGNSQSPQAIRAEEVCRQLRPDMIVHCGPAARSSWDPSTSALITDRLPDDCGQWAAAAAAHDAKFTMISSDAVFTGPWMFHDEDGPGYCDSPESQRILQAEKRVQQLCPTSLIIRTHLFGWAPTEAGPGWLESLLARIESKRTVEQDPIRHASPMLATDLAPIINRCWDDGLQGIFHVAGAERVNPLNFAQRLADQFHLPWLTVRKDDSTIVRPFGFGAGECSLQTKRIRLALCVAMPLLNESLERLEHQQVDGFRSRLGKKPQVVQLQAS